MLAAAAPLSIVGVRQGDQLRRPAASATPLRLKLSALGGSGQRWWFLDGTPLGSTQGADSLALALQERGQHQLSVLDEGGLTARVEFQVLE